MGIFSFLWLSCQIKQPLGFIRTFYDVLRILACIITLSLKLLEPSSLSERHSGISFVVTLPRCFLPTIQMTTDIHDTVLLIHFIKYNTESTMSYLIITEKENTLYLIKCIQFRNLQ